MKRIAFLAALGALAAVPAWAQGQGKQYFTYPTASALTGAEILGPIRQSNSDRNATVTQLSQFLFTSPVITTPAITGGTIAGSAITGGTVNNTNVNASVLTFAPIPGCVGDGVANDTTCVQAALTAGGTINLGAHLYKVNALSTSAMVAIIGLQGGGGLYSTTITSGFVAASSNINLLTLTGSNSRVSGVGFSMGTAGANTSGAALTVGVSTQTTIIDNQINYPFVGIDVTGSGSSQNVSTGVIRNVIVGPSNGGAAIRIGVNSVGSNTVDTRVTDNQISASSSNTAIGILMLDAGGLYMRGNDPFMMGTGTKIFPGANQYVQAFIYDVVGDTSYFNDLLIDTASASGQYTDLTFTNTWSSSSLGTNVLIQNTGGGGAGSVMFLNHKTILSPTPPAIAFDIEAGEVSLNGSRVGSKFAAPGSTAIKIGSAAKSVSITALRPFAMLAPTGGTFGSVGTGILVSGANTFQILGNHLTGATTPLSYTPTAGGTDTATIGDNIGVDTSQPTVASASTVALPVNPTVLLSGTTTVNVLTGAWSNRRVKVVAVSGLTLANGTTGGACTNTVLGAAASASLTWDFALGCWIVG